MMKSHCDKCAAHHAVIAEGHRKLAKSHSKIADSTKDSSVGMHHRDLSAHHEAMAKSHDDFQEHAEQMSDKLSTGTVATETDSHSSARDSIRRPRIYSMPMAVLTCEN